MRQVVDNSKFLFENIIDIQVIFEECQLLSRQLINYIFTLKIFEQRLIINI